MPARAALRPPYHAISSIQRHAHARSLHTTAALEIGTISPTRRNVSTSASALVCYNVRYEVTICSAACSAGQVVQQDPQTQRVASCTGIGQAGAQSGGCEAGYTCTFSKALNQNVCCGAPRSAQGNTPLQRLDAVNSSIV